MANLSSSYNCCPSVKNILLLDSEGKRVAVSYYSDDWPTNVTKLAFEKNVFFKTMKTNAWMEDITILDDNIIVYKFVQDLHFFVTGSVEENELLLSSVLQGFFDAVTLLLRNSVDKREALENLNLIFLCLDEIVDRGIILETDASVIAGKVAIQTVDATGAPLAEQVLLVEMARETFLDELKPTIERVLVLLVEMARETFLDELNSTIERAYWYG